MHKHYSYSISLLFLLILFSKWNSKCDSFCLTKRNPSNIRNRTFLSCPWGQEENGATEDEMVGWHHWLSGHAFEQTLGDSEGQGSLACCSPWARKELDTTERLNNSPALSSSPGEEKTARSCFVDGVLSSRDIVGRGGMQCACLLTIYSRALLCWGIAWVQWYLLPFSCLNIH